MHFLWNIILNMPKELVPLIITDTASHQGHRQIESILPEIVHFVIFSVENPDKVMNMKILIANTSWEII